MEKHGQQPLANRQYLGMTLRFADSGYVPMDPLTFRWIQIAHFAVTILADDRALSTGADPFAPPTTTRRR